MEQQLPSSSFIFPYELLSRVRVKVVVVVKELVMVLGIVVIAVLVAVLGVERPCCRRRSL